MSIRSVVNDPPPSGPELRGRALAGVAFTGAATIVIQALSSLQTVVLARLLQPSDFGLVMMVSVIVSLAGIPGGAGIGTALVRRRNLSREVFSSLYWLNLGLGIAAYAVVVAAAPWIAAGYQEPRLLDIVAWAALPLILSTFGTPFQSLVERSLDFRKVARSELAAALAGAAAAVSSAYCGAGVYALIAGNLVTSLSRSLLLLMQGWALAPLLLRLKAADAREDLSFGLHLAAQRLTSFLSSNLDFLLIGRFVGARALGFYVLAYNLANIPSNYVNAVFSRVSYPVLTQLKDDPIRIKSAYLRIQEVTAAINFPILFGMAAVSSIAVPLVYGNAWAQSVPLLKILVVLGLGRSIVGTIGPLLLARGRSDLGFRWSLLVLSLQLPGLYLGVRAGGAEGVAVAFSLLVVLYVLLNYPVLVRTLLGPCLGEYLRTMGAPLLFSSIMVAVVGIVASLVRGFPRAGELAVLVAVGVFVYGGLTLLFRPDWRAELSSLTKPKAPLT